MQLNAQCSRFTPFQNIISPTPKRSRSVAVIVAARESGGRSYRGEHARKSNKGGSYANKNRRKGRPAWQRSPDDTPLRDGNRDRLMGLLTERAARTLLYYFFELNPTLYGWFSAYMKEHEIPKDGNWDDVSGETFLRKLLTTPIEQTRWGQQQGLDSMYDSTGSLIVDPRNVAQRVMEIRSQIAKEWIEELKSVSEENALLMRETVLSSFSMDNLTVAESGPDGISTHPEMQSNSEVDDSAAGGDD